MADTKRRLRVFNLEARGLRVGDSGGSSDPYAILSIGSWKQQTSVQKRTLEPVWVDADYKLDESKIDFSKHFVLRIDLKDKVSFAASNARQHIASSTAEFHWLNRTWHRVGSPGR